MDSTKYEENHLKLCQLSLGGKRFILFIVDTIRCAAIVRGAHSVQLTARAGATARREKEKRSLNGVE